MIGADRIGRTLNANGLPAAVISGSVHQKKRESLLRKFHDGDIRILVATDVAARGLHIPEVTHVYNFDLPNDAGRLRAPHWPHGAPGCAGRSDQFCL